MDLTENYRTAELLLRRPARPGELVVGDKVRPQWIDGGARFWYSIDTPDGKRHTLADPAARTRTDLTEQALADLLATQQPPPPIAPLEVPSPDGGHAISRRGDDLWVRALPGGAERPLTTDGAPDHAYGASPQALGNATLLRKIGLPHLPPAASWSPDSTRVLTHRTDERLVRQAHLVESAPPDGAPPRTHPQHYPHAGDEHLPLCELVVLNVGTGEVVRSQGEPLTTAMLSPVAAGWAWWSEDGAAVYYLSQPRDRRTLSLHRMDPSTGEVTTVLSESGPTRVEPNQWAYEPPIVRVLADEVLWYSQRDGWGHLYRYDLRTGELIGRVTSGEWAVRRILRVADGVVHFTASGPGPGGPVPAHHVPRPPGRHRFHPADPRRPRPRRHPGGGLPPGLHVHSGHPAGDRGPRLVGRGPAGTGERFHRSADRHRLDPAPALPRQGRGRRHRPLRRPPPPARLRPVPQLPGGGHDLPRPAGHQGRPVLRPRRHGP
ncbi:MULTISPECIES: DPP IV N-terminal domain-containing protein [Actinosynnema]|uniref:DPP IV N-terminal domain-containing protein n=1 Tax=Actinosynnema TaxID=40566 RepID=UPI0020A2981B|nr:DPP IV N-terminal domain-containing protein [Actinosynnema pretiosum]MCP2097684.1 Dipeptidyl peptidase IV (DPP IV) N-terminal region [Actinosynnema pretiosum]